MIQHTHTDNLQKQTRRLVAPNTNREAFFRFETIIPRQPSIFLDERCCREAEYMTRCIQEIENGKKMFNFLVQAKDELITTLGWSHRKVTPTWLYDIINSRLCHLLLYFHADRCTRAFYATMRVIHAPSTNHFRIFAQQKWSIRIPVNEV